MKDYKIRDIADQVAKEFGVPKTITRYIARYAVNVILKVIRTDRDRIEIRHSDIMWVYPTPKHELCDEFKDLDESRVLTQRERRIAKHQTNEAKGVFVTMRGKLYYPRLPSGRPDRRSVAEGESD